MGTIKAKNITKKQAIKMFRLYRRMTKAEVLARLPSVDFPAYADWAMKKIELENELREFLFGTSELYELAKKWGMIQPIKKDRRKRKEKEK